MPDFVVYRDIPKSHEIKIHRISCRVYTQRGRDAVNSDWRTVQDFQSALDLAERLAEEDQIHYRPCKLCRPSP